MREIGLLTKSEASKNYDISRVTLDKIIKDRKINLYFAPGKKRNVVGWIHPLELEAVMPEKVKFKNPYPPDLRV